MNTPATPIRLSQSQPLRARIFPATGAFLMKPSGSSTSPVSGLVRGTILGSMGTVLTVPSAEWAGPCTARVTPHQPMRIAAMIVVTTMIFMALSLEAWMPRTF